MPTRGSARSVQSCTSSRPTTIAPHVNNATRPLAAGSQLKLAGGKRQAPLSMSSSRSSLIPPSLGLKVSHGSMRHLSTSSSIHWPSSSRSRAYGVLAGVVTVGLGIWWKSSVVLAEEVELEDDGPFSKQALASGQHLRRLSTSELLRSYIVFAICEQSWLINRTPAILAALEWTRDSVPLVGPGVWWIFCQTMKQTLFKQFVGGEDLDACAPLIASSAARGVGTILDYSSESISQESNTSHRSGVNQEHIEITLDLVKRLGEFGPGQMAAIKLSGLVREYSLLRRASQSLVNSSAYHRGVFNSDGKTLFPFTPDFHDGDMADLAALHEALRKICQAAASSGVTVVVDAEQSWYQPAIDHLTLLLAIEFNTEGPPVVFNTYQCYRRDTPSRIASAAAQIKGAGAGYGWKLVRGAYMEAEREVHRKAKGISEGCVVFNTKAETDECYDRCARQLLEEVVEQASRPTSKAPNTGAIFAGHNVASARKLVDELERLGKMVPAKPGVNESRRFDESLRGRLSFGQLYGMSDNLTEALLSFTAPPQDGRLAAPFVLKCTPFASVAEAIPYLVRRANENKSVLGAGGALAERRARGKELRRRISGALGL